MVTDGQYQELKNQVAELEKKVNVLSIQLGRLLLKGDVDTYKEPIMVSRKKRDTTKYRFSGEIYCKRRVVYECIKQYIEDKNIDSYQKVVEVFPDYIQGSLGVIKPINLAEKYANAHRRFYFSDNDIIYLSGKPYVVCSQWEKKNISHFLQKARDLGYIIEEISLN